MSGKILKEMQCKDPVDSVHQEVFLNVIRTADYLMRGFEEILKPYSLSATQYHVLKILRRAENMALSCKQIAERMITRDPDITRLLDRLEARKFIARNRDVDDRRVVSTRITPEGLSLLAQLDDLVREFHVRQLAHVPASKLTCLLEHLETLRDANGAVDMPCPASEG